MTGCDILLYNCRANTVDGVSLSYTCMASAISGGLRGDLDSSARQVIKINNCAQK